MAGGDTVDFFKRYVRSERPIAVTSHKRMYLGKDGDVVHTEDMEQNMTSVRSVTKSWIFVVKQLLNGSHLQVGFGVLSPTREL